MLTPEYLQGMPDELVGIFEELEGDIIKDICRRIEKTAMITDTAEYEMLRLRELGAGEKYIEGLMKKTLNASDDEVERMVFDAAQVSDEFYKKAYAAKGKGFTPYEYNDFTGQLVTAAVNQTRGELKNLTRSAGFAYDRHFNGVRKTYADTLDYAHMQVSTGATDYITAVRNATKKLTDSGLQFVDYESGVRNHCDVAVRRAVLTGVSQMAGEIAAHNMRELDTDIVEVSAHACARPEHALWQGRLYSYSGRDRRYPSLVAVTGYGTVTGLMGANCRHTFYPFIPGVSQRNYTEDELRSIDPPPFEYEGRTYTAYEASQKQRQIEREIRKTKREIIAAEATGDKDRLTVKAVRLRRQNELYHDFSKAAGLREQKERMQVNGYGRKTSMKTVWAERDTDYMSNSFRPQYAKAENLSLDDTRIIIPVKRVTNSKYEMYTDVESTRRDKAVRLANDLMGSVEGQLPNDFKLPPVAVVDFEKHGISGKLDAIGGYDRNSDTLFLNSKYDTRQKILEYVNRQDMFANKTEYAPILHELGHKYYYDSIKRLAKSDGIGYNEAQKTIDSRILDTLSGVDIKNEISEYAHRGLLSGAVTEIAAECFTICDTNNVAIYAINSLRR